jgi:hypothetical protein
VTIQYQPTNQPLATKPLHTMQDKKYNLYQEDCINFNKAVAAVVAVGAIVCCYCLLLLLLIHNIVIVDVSYYYCMVDKDRTYLHACCSHPPHTHTHTHTHIFQAVQLVGFDPPVCDTNKL